MNCRRNRAMPRRSSILAFATSLEKAYPKMSNQRCIGISYQLCKGMQMLSATWEFAMNLEQVWGRMSREPPIGMS